MEHNFIWTTKDVENAPECLYAGIEFNDNRMVVTNLNPNKDEYYMGEGAMNPEFDLTKLTTDWFHGSVKVDGKNTTLEVHIYDPAGEQPDDSASRWTNLQILPEGNFYLEIFMSNDMIDPMMLPENRH